MRVETVSLLPAPSCVGLAQHCRGGVLRSSTAKEESFEARPQLSGSTGFGSHRTREMESQWLPAALCRLERNCWAPCIAGSTCCPLLTAPGIRKGRYWG